jgi:CopG family transcriptional regulator, nickel-responsive regulator
MRREEVFVVERVGISLDKGLLERFDSLIEKRGGPNRSEAIRDLIRDALVTESWAEEHPKAEAVAAVVIVYDHHSPELAHRISEIQHRNHDAVVSTLHVHLDAHHCMETIVLRGPAREIEDMGNAIIGARGVRHGKFVGTTTGIDF